MSNDARSGLVTLAAALRPLHKALLDEQRLEYERAHGDVANPAALLQLVTADPAFAWLRGLSGLMADLDELIDDPEPIAADRAKRMRARLEALLIEEPAFAERYREMLQRSAEVVIAHAAVRGALGRI
jgi:hypothetical protein